MGTEGRMAAAKWKVSGLFQKKSDMTARRPARKSQMSLLRAPRDGQRTVSSKSCWTQTETDGDDGDGDPPHHHGRLGLRPLWLPPPRLRRLPREHQVFELLQICRAAAPILVLSGTDQNLPSGKKTIRRIIISKCVISTTNLLPLLFIAFKEKKSANWNL